MKKIFFTLMFYVAVMISPAFSVSLDSSDSELTENMVGDWNCEYVTSVPGIDVIGRSSESFVSDGSAFSHNLIIIKFTALSENMDNEALVGKTLQLTISEKYQWQVNNKRLVRTTGEVTIDDVSDPELADLLGVDEWDLTSGAEDATFFEVSSQKVKFKNPNSDELVACQRQVNII